MEAPSYPSQEGVSALVFFVVVLPLIFLLVWFLVVMPSALD